MYCDTELYDDTAEKMENIKIKENTIIVDPMVYFPRNLSKVNNGKATLLWRAFQRRNFLNSIGLLQPGDS
ncbi:hypothetical protein SDC9_114868 [bioreactor metagenome]|uniref:Uncharacterized protein n=1 Tax=bioreactor metagenome TaxID=1076179 RepID=A0A645BXV1_9ZZZZ